MWLSNSRANCGMEIQIIRPTPSMFSIFHNDIAGQSQGSESFTVKSYALVVLYSMTILSSASFLVTCSLLESSSRSRYESYLFAHIVITLTVTSLSRPSSNDDLRRQDLIIFSQFLQKYNFVFLVTCLSYLALSSSPQYLCSSNY